MIHCTVTPIRHAGPSPHAPAVQRPVAGSVARAGRG